MSAGLARLRLTGPFARYEQSPLAQRPIKLLLLLLLLLLSSVTIEWITVSDDDGEIDKRHEE